MKLVEWNSLRHVNTNEPQTEIEGQIVAAVVSDIARYYIEIVGDCIKIQKSGFGNDQISVLPNSSNTILIK